MMERQRALADVDRCQDPDVQSVASFIGADGTNPTTNSGRLSITLKPRDQRTASARRDHRAPAAEARAGRGHPGLPAVGAGPADRQPRQPHAVPVHARGRRPDRARRRGRRSCSPSSASEPELRDVASDQRDARACRCRSTIDRDTASRLGHHAAGHRRHALRRLRPAAGLDHLHAAQPLPRHPRGEAGVAGATPPRSTRSTCARRPATPVPLSAIVALRRRRTAPLAINHQGQFPAVTLSFNLAPGESLGDAVDGHRRGRRRASGLPPSVHADFQGTAQAFHESLASEPLLILAALITVYIVLGVLYESYIHPITILSTLPSAGVGALLALLRLPHRLQRHRAHRHRPAHRHREEERDHDDRLRARGGARPGHDAPRRRSTRRACCASGRS